MGYRNDKTTGVATGEGEETMYMVTRGDHVNAGCCFDCAPHPRRPGPGRRHAPV